MANEDSTSEVMVCLEWQAIGTESDCCVKLPCYPCYLGGLGPNYNMIVQQKNRHQMINVLYSTGRENMCVRNMTMYLWKGKKQSQVDILL